MCCLKSDTSTPAHAMFILHCKQLKMICGLFGKRHTDWDRSRGPTSKTSIFYNRKNTIEALVNDHLGNSEKWLQLELVAIENGFGHKAWDLLMVTTSVVVIILNKVLLPVTEAAQE